MSCTGTSAEHEDEHSNLQLTAYSDKLELYAEAHPMVAGQEGMLLCHFSYLDDFKPVKEGEVTVRLHAGGKTSETKSSTLERDGIYRLTIKPEAVGKASLEITVRNQRVGTTILHVDSLQVFADAEAADADAQQHQAKSASGVSFTKEMSWGVDFGTSQAEMLPIGNVIKTVAQVQPTLGDETVISAKTDGIVRLAQDRLTEGMTVRSGMPICSIDASQTAAGNLMARQQQANAELKRAEAELARLESLRQDKLALESEVQNARAAYESANATVVALQKGFGQGTQNVTSTRSGFLKRLMVKNGQYVSTGDIVAVVGESRTLQLKAEVPASAYADLSKISGASINGRSLADLGGRLLSYGRQTSVENPLIPVTFEVNNQLDLVPGTFVDMYITTSSSDSRLCVLREAIVEEMGNTFVYVQLTPEFFEKRQVRTGVTDGIHTEIIHGITPDDRVVSHGTMLVKMQQAAGGVDAESGHSH